MAEELEMESEENLDAELAALEALLGIEEKKDMKSIEITEEVTIPVLEKQETIKYEQFQIVEINSDILKRNFKSRFFDLYNKTHLISNLPEKVEAVIVSTTDKYAGIYILHKFKKSHVYKNFTPLSKDFIFYTEGTVSKLKLGEIKKTTTELKFNNIISKIDSCVLEHKKLKESTKISVVDTRIEKVKELAEEIYPGNWDFQKRGSYYSLYIHFPEITISNSRKKSHIIHDLYVRFDFKLKDMSHTGNIYGVRGKLSYGEFNSNYSHSHLSTSYRFSFGPFCLGRSEFSNTFMGLKADIWNQDNFRKLLIMLYGYVQWESLEGGPHIQMSNIKTGSNSRSTNVNKDHIEQAYRQFLVLNKSFPLKLQNERGLNKFIVDNNSDFEKLVTKCTDLKKIKTVDGTYLNIITSNIEANRQIDRINRDYGNSSSIFTYKGKSIKPIVMRYDDKTEDQELVADPKITSGVKNMLEKEVNNYIIKK